MAEDFETRARKIAQSRSARLDQNQAAYAEWIAKLPECEKAARAAVKPFNDARWKDLFVAKTHTTLVVSFGQYFGRRAGLLEMVDGPMAVFAFNIESGHVQGHRVPFRPKKAVEPHEIDSSKIGNAVVDFVDWATGARQEGD